MIRQLRGVFLVLMTSGVSLGQLPEADDWRKFTDAETDRTVIAKIAEKKPDNSEIRIVLKKGGTMWVKVSRFSDADKEYIKAWELTDLKLLAKTVATSTSRTKWSETWGKFDSKGVEILSENVSEEFRARTVSVTLENRGSVENYVMEFFWMGFPLKDKTQRVINSVATRNIKVPAGQRHTIRVGSTYRYTDASLLYLRSDRTLFKWEGLYVRSWSGYSYAGWAVRISDGEGAIVKQSAAQPSFLRHIEKIPLPIRKK